MNRKVNNIKIKVLNIQQKCEQQGAQVSKYITFEQVKLFCYTLLQYIRKEEKTLECKLIAARFSLREIKKLTKVWKFVWIENMIWSCSCMKWLLSKGFTKLSVWDMSFLKWLMPEFKLKVLCRVLNNQLLVNKTVKYSLLFLGYWKCFIHFIADFQDMEHISASKLHVITYSRSYSLNNSNMLHTNISA